MTKEFEDYHYLATLLKTHCKNFETLTAFGTDGEINLANGSYANSHMPSTLGARFREHREEVGQIIVWQRWSTERTRHNIWTA